MAISSCFPWEFAEIPESHKLATTTNVYLRPTEKDNEDELRLQGRIKDPNVEISLETHKKRKRPLPKK